MNMRYEVNFTNQHPGASVWEKGSLGRMAVLVKTVVSTVQEHEGVICSGHNHGQRNDFPCRNDLTLTLST